MAHGVDWCSAHDEMFHVAEIQCSFSHTYFCDRQNALAQLEEIHLS